MEISFKIVGDVQIIEIDGELAEPEAAAVRVKLEQKINQGRSKILFDLGNYRVANDSARKLLINIIIYSVNRGALTACCGVRSSDRPLFILPDPKQVKIFFTRTEGLDYLTKAAPENPKAVLGAKRKSEEQIKEEGINKLLEKYEAFQHNDDDDPYRLQFLSDLYQTTPSLEALQIERKAEASFLEINEEIEKLERACDSSAKNLKGLLLYRKTPLSGRELKMKQKELETEVADQENHVAKLKGEVAAGEKAIEVAKAAAVKTKTASEEAVRNLENDLRSTGESFAKEAAELQRLDSQEQANLEARLKG